MRDCGVCLTLYDDGETIGYQCRIVKASREWKCSECHGVIPKGSKYEIASGFRADDGNSFWQTKTCLICAEIAEAFYCSGRWHGLLWDSMEKVWGELTTGCLTRLKTPEAKKELLRRWNEWKFTKGE